MTVRLNRAGMAAYLKDDSNWTRATRVAGEAVADRVRGQGIYVEGEPGDVPLPVEVEDDGEVVIAHPSGLAVEAKHSPLTRGASEVGLRVS